jgi:AraC-like DNA-binding protein
VLVTIEAGCGTLKLGSGLWRLARSSEFWLYSTRQQREWIPDQGRTLVTQWMSFGGPALDAWLEELDVFKKPHFILPHSSAVRRTMHELEMLARRRPPRWERAVHWKIMALLERFLDVRCPLDADTKRMPGEIARVLHHIAADPARDWSVRELAQLAGLSYSGFRAQFRSAMNESTHDYLQRARLDLARELLADDNLRVKDVAEKLHFSSEYYFSHFFRRHTGSSPTEFRRHLGLEH